MKSSLASPHLSPSDHEKTKLIIRDPEAWSCDPHVAAEAKKMSPLGRVCDTVSLAYLITESNIKAYVQPVVLFSMLSIASGGMTTNTNPSWAEMAMAFPRSALYTWLYVLHFDCSNQKDADSIEEDRINKPWRAIPSGRLSMEGAERWYKAATALLLLASGLWLGGFPEAVAFMAQTYVYDSARGASTWWSRNILNALFYTTGQLGATRVAAASMTATELTRAGFEWCALLGLSTLTTIQMQDLRDAEGDGARGRRTMPLVLGDTTTRWVTAVLVWVWSAACPAYWSGGHATAAYVLPLLVGSIVATRTLALKAVKADRLTLNIYTLVWLPTLYAIPLLAKHRIPGLF